MSVTLEQAHILLQEMQMESSSFQHALDAMRRWDRNCCVIPNSIFCILTFISQGTRLRNAEKNVGVALYAFNPFQVFTLPFLYKPPDGTYKKLQT